MNTPHNRIKPPAALEPLSGPVFRMLWLSAAMANVCMWMSEVAAAWLMTTLHTEPLWVALVQTAATLPMFLFGLPSGALADLIDRRRYFLFTQIWVSGVAMLLSVCTFLGVMNPSLLLALMFANGLGLAMRWPLFSAIVPELVPRAQLSAALALNSVSMNMSRVLGPLIAGSVIAHFGTAWVFMLNACLSLLAAWSIGRWRRTPSAPAAQTSLWKSMSQGLQFMRHSRSLQILLARIFSFFFHAIAIIALLAVRARQIESGQASIFTLLLMSLGLGAISATFALPWLRARFSRDALVLRGSAAQALAMFALAWLNQLWLLVPVMLLAGATWIVSANTLTLSMQLQLPDAMRARGMAMYQMAIMGAGAIGAAVWGQLATWSHVSWSLSLTAISAPLCMAAVIHWLPERAATHE